MAARDEQLPEVTQRLECAEDTFLNLIERYPHSLKELQAIEIMRELRMAISHLRTLR